MTLNILLDSLSPKIQASVSVEKVEDAGGLKVVMVVVGFLF